MDFISVFVQGLATTILKIIFFKFSRNNGDENVFELSEGFLIFLVAKKLWIYHLSMV